MQNTVIIVDDEPEIINSLRWLIESVGIQVQAFKSGEDFLAGYKKYEKIADCVILDVRMKGMSGLKVQETLIGLKNRIPIIFLTGHGDIQMAAKAMKNGAVDFFIKPFNNQQLLDSIYSAIEKSNNIKSHLCETEKIEKNISKLSPREFGILKKILEGKLNKVIAHELGISISTTEAHRAKIMKKMEVTTLAALVKACIAAKICDIE
jgi:two-component system, LuxR family, response regulator FixJ